jgi:hypothetical protein
MSVLPQPPRTRVCVELADERAALTGSCLETRMRFYFTWRGTERKVR